jgi:lauroyl/myristoyl acyltransferase
MRELSAGKGVIIIGFHCLVRIYGLIFYENQIQLKILAKNPVYYNHMLISCLQTKQTKRDRYINDNYCFVEANYSERALVRHVINGGAVLIYIDFPLEKGKSYEMNFLGYPIKFSAFPFKMALRYNIPLFFSFVSERKDGSYRLSVIPSGNFSTPEEGLSKYIQMLQAVIKENPFMWKWTPSFAEWIDKSNTV